MIRCRVRSGVASMQAISCKMMYHIDAKSAIQKTEML
jgi:hypothetical protein